MFADVDAAREDHVSIMNSSDESHRHAPVDMTPNGPNLSVSSTFPRISCTPTIVQYQEQSASRYYHQRFQKSEKRPCAASLRSYYRGRAGIRGASKRVYSCNICSKVYAQPQGVTRHHREAHQVSTCMYCGDFKWGRPYLFRKHLKEQHPNVDPDTVLGGPTGPRCNVTIIPKHSPPQWGSPPTSEHDGLGRAEPRLCSLALPSSAVAEVTPLSPPVMLSLGYDPQPKHAELMNTTQRHELYDVTYDCATEAHAQPANGDLEITSQSGQICHAFSAPIPPPPALTPTLSTSGSGHQSGKLNKGGGNYPLGMLTPPTPHHSTLGK